jgi:hypothetical protein
LQQQLQDYLGETLMKRLANPSAGFEDIETSAVGGINRDSRGLQRQLDQSLAERGFSRSGTAGFNAAKLDSERVGRIGEFRGRLAGFKVDQGNQTIQQALAAAFRNPGMEQTGAGSAGGGNPLWAGLAGGLSSPGFADLIRRIPGLGGGGGGVYDGGAP